MEEGNPEVDRKGDKPEEGQKLKKIRGKKRYERKVNDIKVGCFLHQHKAKLKPSTPFAKFGGTILTFNISFVALFQMLHTSRKYL
jgi:hypothetical protein